jgi:hypothetical protein
VAGGGGGSANIFGGFGGRTTTDGGTGDASGGTGGAGGTDGNGGGSGEYLIFIGGGGGGGSYSNGGQTSGSAGGGVASGAGGAGVGGGGSGGFGGGGGGGESFGEGSGGGGGGYSGGGGGGGASGGGGGSFVAGVETVAVAGENSGNGFVTIEQLTCFVRGTSIRTPGGEISVENLRVGDRVVTHSGDSKEIIWIGHRSIDVARCGGGIDAYPVHIRAHAFCDNVPSRDLLITSEHCIFVDGHLIPVRMLVNGGSIYVDTSIVRYEYFHVELASHSIIFAEGLETESYLDTGNRRSFANAPVTRLYPLLSIELQHKSWTEHAAAPLGVDRATVEPIWRRLSVRSNRLGFVAPPSPSLLVRDPDLHLLTETGLTIRPDGKDDRIIRFLVPSSAGRLRLRSRAARPSNTIGPYVDDRRDLGVLVGHITCHNGTTTMNVTGHLADDSLAGWHAMESGSQARWTNGNALLPVDITRAPDASFMLSVEVLNGGPYVLEKDKAQIIAA